jgi:hypothetical protein
MTPPRVGAGVAREQRDDWGGLRRSMGKAGVRTQQKESADAPLPPHAGVWKAAAGGINRAKRQDWQRYIEEVGAPAAPVGLRAELRNEAAGVSFVVRIPPVL